MHLVGERQKKDMIFGMISMQNGEKLYYIYQKNNQKMNHSILYYQIEKLNLMIN